MHFAKEIAALSGERGLHTRSRLRELSLFEDVDGLLRVGGRLKHSLLLYEQKHPLILPGESRFTRLLIEASHRRTLHGGTQLILGP